MDGKTAVQSRFIWLIQFGIAIVIILWSAIGWAQDDERKLVFKPAVVQRLTPRSGPATVTTEEESALASKGYIKIGTIGGSLPNIDAKTMKDQILAMAASAGGDLVRLDQDGVFARVSIPEEKVRHICQDWQESSYVTGSYGKQVKNITRTCKSWYDKPVTVSKKVPGLRSEGTIWRLDPALSADIALQERTKTLGPQYANAMRSGDWAAAKSLLEVNPELILLKCDAGDASGMPHETLCLDVAVVRGNTEMVKLFLTHNADVNARDSWGQTPLHIAAINGNVDMAKLLLSHHADIYAKDSNSDTPLHAAAGYGNKDVTELLLTYNASIYANANKGIDPELLRAAEAEGYKPATRVAPDTDVNAKGYNGDTPLLRAVKRGHKDVAELLVAHNADVNAKDKDNITPLHIASENGYDDIAKLLIAHNADVNAKGKDNMTPLLYAVKNGHEDIAKLLIAHNADVNAKGEYGITPLLYTAQFGYKGMAELLIAHNRRRQCQE